MVNKVAVSNVKDHLTIKAHEYQKCEQKAKEDGMSEKYIEMYHDMAYLYADLLGYLEQTDLVNKPTIDAVEVVRCKDCKYYYEDIGWCDKHSYYDEDEWKMFYKDDYYSDGETRAKRRGRNIWKY